MQIRRVVAAVGPNGKSSVLQDGVAPRAAVYRSVPGFESALLWSSPADAIVGSGSGAVDTTPRASFVPSAGATRLMMVTFPPDSVMTRPDFDGAAFGA